MEKTNESGIMLIPKTNNIEVITQLEQISKPLEMFVKYNNLPTENVLASNDEKAKLFSNFAFSIDTLPIDIRSKSDYLTKFIVAGAVGLFDGALNFLWDEIVRSLRSKAVNYDIVYFYSIAEQINTQYKKLSSIQDIEEISDYDLLLTLKRINFLDEYAFTTLSNINYLRNHASAAHPNINELSGIKLSSLLEDGIKYSILLEPDSSTIEVKKLFNNIRCTEIPDEDFDDIASELKKLSIERINDFSMSIFGLYCDLKTDGFALNNILEISKRIWSATSEDNKYMIGSKFGYYRKNGSVDQKDRVNKYLETVGGLKYKDNDSIVADLIEKINQLRSVHFRMNNFYNEYSYAKDIALSLPTIGIPAPIRTVLVKTICICFAGNGCGYRDGVDEDAVVLYEEMIKQFGNEEIKDFILLFSDEEFTIDFNKQKVEQRVKIICEKLKKKTTNSDLINGLDLILRSHQIDKIKLSSEYSIIEKKLIS